MVTLRIVSCEACAVSKITWGSFHPFHSGENQPFEELHMDLVGPIALLSCEGHKYFLTIVDSCTNFCSAIPIKHKSKVAGVTSQAVGFEAKRIGYDPMDTSLNRRLSRKIVRTSVRFETTICQPVSGNWEESGFGGRVQVWRGGGQKVEVEGGDE
ncbi:hypothetical protein VP01_2890g1 [Puccinia sorghi]|uniref:Integrase catalytic domain-containing protein n=1 Tax=Puccinia sorghi TaxID=27349 RepID=A0A0L6V2B5_9BASI|nr:hypothetical protein VP01_2890g1 [Puccinia sorghi]